MRARRPCALVPGPLENFAVQFDPLFSFYVQRANFGTYVSRLLLPHDRAKTLTALAGAVTFVQAQVAPVQQLQFFLPESTWDAESINRRRLQLSAANPATATTDQGVW